jgi:hypothetical protein
VKPGVDMSAWKRVRILEKSCLLHEPPGHIFTFPHHIGLPTTDVQFFEESAKQRLIDEGDYSAAQGIRIA